MPRRLCFILTLLLAEVLPAQDNTLHVRLPRDKDVVLTVAQLRALPNDTLRFAPHHGTAATYRAVRLADVLRAVGSPIDSLRVGRKAWVIVAEASDGYVVAFSAAEADSALSPTRIWLAFESDGKPLAPEEGPFRLLVPTDARAARAAHQLVRLRVVDAAK